MSNKLTTEDANAVIAASVRNLAYSSVKEKQMLVIVNFLIGNDVFVAFPTGNDYSVFSIFLPATFDRLKSVEETSIVVIVSPLTAVTKDQVALCSSKGVCAARMYISP